MTKQQLMKKYGNRELTAEEFAEWEAAPDARELRPSSKWDDEPCVCGADRYCGRDSHRPSYAVDENNSTIYFDQASNLRGDEDRCDRAQQGDEMIKVKRDEWLWMLSTINCQSISLAIAVGLKFDSITEMEFNPHTGGLRVTVGTSVYNLMTNATEEGCPWYQGVKLDELPPELQKVVRPLVEKDNPRIK